MKRSLAAAAALLVLAAVILTTLSLRLDSTATPLPVTVKAARGDVTAAEGLRFHTAVKYGTRLRWDTEYDVGSNTWDTVHRMPGGSDNGRLYYYDRREDIYDSRDNNRRYIALMAQPEDAMIRHLVAGAKAAQENGELYGRDYTERIRMRDFYDTYPLYLTWDRNDMNQLLRDDLHTYYDDTLPAFDKLRIPVGETDWMEPTLYYYADNNMSLYGDTTLHAENRFTSFSVGLDEGFLTTVGFAADADPQPEWAPEGFGLWYVPVRMQKVTNERSGLPETVRGRFPVVAECRLVYPLDIGTQRVMLLRQSDDGAHILLVTAENDRYVLRVLDSGDYHLVRQIELCEATAHEHTENRYIYEDYGPWREPTESAHYRYSYPDENDRGTAELQVTRTAYPEVSMQQGDNFAAVIIGSRLALLTPSAEGYDLQFVCDTVSYGYEMWKDDPDDTYWYQEDLGWLFTGGVPSDPNSSVYQAYTVATVEERYAMAYNGTSLAVATYYGNRLMLSVYGPDGFQYAALVKNNVLDQIDSTGTANPVCQDELRSYQEYYYPQPGLSWS